MLRTLCRARVPEYWLPGTTAHHVLHVRPASLPCALRKPPTATKAPAARLSTAPMPVLIVTAAMPIKSASPDVLVDTSIQIANAAVERACADGSPTIRFPAQAAAGIEHKGEDQRSDVGNQTNFSAPVLYDHCGPRRIQSIHRGQRSERVSHLDRNRDQRQESGNDPGHGPKDQELAAQAETGEPRLAVVGGPSGTG